MTETSQQLLRDQLQDERNRVREQLANLGHGASADGDGGALDFDENFADSGQVTAERGEVDALAGNLLEALRDVDDAIAKLERGDYGTCESCGRPIAESRLEAMPSARLCISCASASR